MIADSTRLLNKLQLAFPIEPAPFARLAKSLGTCERDVIRSVEELKARGVIRRIGAVFSSRMLGYASTLAAARVPPSSVDRFAKILREYHQVTHNYLRDCEPNVWFTVIDKDRASLQETLRSIAKRTGVRQLWNLPAERVFKIDADFRVGAEERPARARKPRAARPKVRDSSLSPLSEMERAVVREIQGDIPAAAWPFAILASRLGMREKLLIGMIRRWRRNGTIRKFGAIVRHLAVGVQGNAMVVWQVPSGAVERAGRIAASFSEVSHCYLRPPLKKWKYNLYTMVHGRNREACGRAIRRIAAALPAADHRVLCTIAELKKTSPEYFR